MKKCFLLFICLLMLLFTTSCNDGIVQPFDDSEVSSVLDNTNNSEGKETDDFSQNPITDFQYEFSSDGESVYITKYIGSSDVVIIPSKIEGVPVISLKGDIIDGVILKGVFENCSVKKVVVPNSITVIGMRTFSGCKELIEISVSDQCEKILDGAFQDCLKLESIDLSRTKISLIGISAFEGCVKLSEIKFPTSLLKIDRRAFYNCTALLNVHLPQNLLTIEGEAFFNCTSLKMITIPNKLNLLYSDSVRFYNMPSLEKIIFDEGREEIDGYAFIDTTTNVEIVIPKSVQKFSPSSFFVHGQAKFVFLGDCPEIIEKTDFYGTPTIYYDPNMRGWDNCPWKDRYPCFPDE